MLENGKFPSFNEMQDYQERGINCFSAFDDNPEFVKETLKLVEKLTFSDKCSIKDSLELDSSNDRLTIDESFDVLVETNPFVILNQTNPFFADAIKEYKDDFEINENLNSHMDKFHKFSAGSNFKQQISDSSNSLLMSDDSLNTVD